MKQKFIRFFSRVNAVSKHSKRSRIKVLMDFLALKKELNISFYEYYKFNLEEESDLRTTFLSAKNKAYLLEFVNPRRYFALARNKYLTHVLLERHQINKAQLFCYYNPLCTNVGDLANNIDGVFTLLKEKNVEQCVVKTTESSHGEGVVVIQKMNYLERDIELLRFDNQKVLLSEILGKEPLIFEDLVKQTEAMAKLNKSSVNTVRIMTALHPNGNAEVFGAFLKVGRNGACVDNAGNGGNVCAKVNIHTGQVSRVINFGGWRNWEFVSKHPDSLEVVDGIYIDNWEGICSKLIDYQKNMPFLKAIGWDVAITESGPLIIEMNDYWDETGQLFIGEGWLGKLRQLDKEWRYEH